MSPLWGRLALGLALSLAGGCTDFRPPSEIVEPQLLGIRAQPAVVPPDESARIAYLVAGVQGPLEDVPVAWEVAPGPGGAPPLGSMEEGEEGEVRYVAPAADEIDAERDEPVAVIRGVFSLPHRDVVAVKSVPIGGSRDNPDIEQVTLEGDAIGDGGNGGTLAAGAAAELAVRASIPLDDVNDVTWAATIGEIERYLRTPARWSIPESAEGSAWLYVVVRDDEGGADWDAFPIEIAP